MIPILYGMAINHTVFNFIKNKYNANVLVILAFLDQFIRAGIGRSIDDTSIIFHLVGSLIAQV